MQQMEDRPNRGENAGHSLQEKTKDEDRRQRPLEDVENIALDAPWYVRNVDIQRDLKFTIATERIKESAVKIFQKTESSENQLLREAVNYDPELEAPHKRPRYHLLDNG